MCGEAVVEPGEKNNSREGESETSSGRLFHSGIVLRKKFLSF